MGFLDVLLRKVIQIAGESLTERRYINFVSGATAVDNPTTGATDITILGAGGGGFDVQLPVTVDSGGATISDVSNAGTFKFEEGTIASDETITVPAAATNADAYTRVYRNATSYILTIDAGAGTTVDIGAGLNAILGVDPDGVYEMPTGAG